MGWSYEKNGPRVLRNEVGKCRECGSSAVQSFRFQRDKEHGRQRYCRVVCSNPNCAKNTSLYTSTEGAIRDWLNGWGKAKVFE